MSLDPKPILAVAAAAAVVGLTVGCGANASGAGPAGAHAAGLPQGAQPVTLDPAAFTTKIDNPWWPMPVGARWVFREADPGEPVLRVVVTVTRRTKRMADGVRARVVHDVVRHGGRTIENTLDWYAQDRAGNIWYLGEDTTEYARDGSVSTAGSWEAGVDGAQPGIAVPAHPRAGMRYRQEYHAGDAEDRAVVLSTSGRVRVPAGRFDDLLTTRDFTPLEPKGTERKYYARGIGPVLSIALHSGGREALVRHTH
ncbi:MAG TPA: hypothetical protein VE972_07135 [Conexibacter sp.]|nr:hypothetical protein [Conexibacter sp.]